jgi:hypothetical protein
MSAGEWPDALSRSEPQSCLMFAGPRHFRHFSGLSGLPLPAHHLPLTRQSVDPAVVSSVIGAPAKSSPVERLVKSRLLPQRARTGLVQMMRKGLCEEAGRQDRLSVASSGEFVSMRTRYRRCQCSDEVGRKTLLRRTQTRPVRGRLVRER